MVIGVLLSVLNGLSGVAKYLNYCSGVATVCVSGLF